jgi:isocitrate/isopropylmalate dehydrogenase
VSDKKTYKIAIIPCDGIGKDVIRGAKLVLDAVNEVETDFSLEMTHYDAGQSALEKSGNPFPQESLEGVLQADATLFGASDTPGVLGEFKVGMDLYANVRPILALPGTNALRPEADFVIVRENTEGLFSRMGWHYRDQHVNCRMFTDSSMERIIRYAFKYAIENGRKKVTLTHKAHVLTYTDGPFRDMFYEIAPDYPQIEAEDMTVDTCGMFISLDPGRLDVIITENSNGDLLSDVGAGVVGGKGYAYSGGIGDSKAYFEPIHGTARKYEDKNIVNPSAAILCCMMMLEYLGEKKAGSTILQSLKDVLVVGEVRTHHMGGEATTTEFGEAVAEQYRLIG